MNKIVNLIDNIINILLSLRGFIYFITIFFIIILGLILFLPFGKDNTFHLGNLHIDFEPINLGDLGGFLSGVFAPLAFLWLILNMKQQDKNLEIAEKQLSILLQEKENRRKITKAHFETQPSNPELLLPYEKQLHFKVKISSNSPLVDCYVKDFIKGSYFSLLFSSSTKEKNLSIAKKNIAKDEPFYLNILVNTSKLNNDDTNLVDYIEIYYLDIDGFEQVQNFKVNFYISKFNHDDTDISKMHTILFLQPQNH
ncbi:hypothetical protein R4462_04450 [Acinetobacter baumannii]|uniref:hypothetical protein n=1 Tax=Acinetobacter baumannii TaxID=470 RepID=UPI0008DD22B7|nr:hypothetical protein [Acinetobacter baumannii]MDC4459929.1 hypothetical protein [Acinetobacter baumannii]MDC4950402.1 hypothetical protein [Acinetobacter baumannii]MDC5609677.1 hypothetical protein [Acinetobacter baumannii]MDO7472422.1 hypothetical protein [Acinetobacter baumannii]MDO7491831.1 hypothetical protein [Acinetobacter baumannii]